MEEEEQVAIFLGLLIVGKEPLLEVCGIFQVTGNFVLLRHESAL